MANDTQNQGLTLRQRTLLKLEQSLQHSSLDSMLREDENVMLLIDTSSSMNAPIDRKVLTSEGRMKTCIDGLREVVHEVLTQGHVPMIAFGGPYDAQVRFVDSVPNGDGGTPLHLAIPMAKQYGATRLVVISDGMPDLTEESMNAARSFGGQIDVVYVGPVQDSKDSLYSHYGRDGETFLRLLAQATGGKQITHSFGEIKALAATVIGLLSAGDEPAKPVIQGAGFTTVEAEPDADDADDADDDDAEEDDDDDDDSEDDE